MGENLPLVGHLLGHLRRKTMAGYAHLADDPLVEAEEQVEDLIAWAIKIVLPICNESRVGAK